MTCSPSPPTSTGACRRRSSSTAWAGEPSSGGRSSRCSTTPPTPMRSPRRSSPSFARYGVGVVGVSTLFMLQRRETVQKIAKFLESVRVGIVGSGASGRSPKSAFFRISRRVFDAPPAPSCAASIAYSNGYGCGGRQADIETRSVCFRGVSRRRRWPRCRSGHDPTATFSSAPNSRSYRF